MYIEDIIHKLAAHTWLMSSGPYRSHHRDMVVSFSNQLKSNIALTEKQRTAALKILKSNLEILIQLYNADISSNVKNPQWKMEIRERKDVRHVSIVDHEIHSRLLQLEMSYNPPLIDGIRKEILEFLKDRGEKNNITWDPQKKVWISALNESLLICVYNIVKKNNFTASEEFIELAEKCLEHVSNIDNIVPILDLDENSKPILKNVSEYIPKLESTELLPALFEARKLGVNVWSDRIEGLLENSEYNDVSKLFLRSDYQEQLSIDSDNTPISSLVDIVKNMSPIVIIIPGGSELEKLNMLDSLFNLADIKSEEVSVLFRLSSNNHSDFNSYVKNMKYNNPLSEKTKVAVLSDKMKKPLVESNIKFHAAINFGSIGGAHKSMHIFHRNQENIIIYSPAVKQRSFHFGNM